MPLDNPAELDAVWQAAQFAMATLLAGDPLKNIPHAATVERGQVWEVLAALIQQHDIDLLVLGTRGRRGLKKLVLGSVAEQIFRQAACPVLTVGPHVAGDGMAEVKFARILFATDFSSGSLQALPYAVLLARTNSSHLILLHALAASTEVSWEAVIDGFAGKRQQVANLVPAMQDVQPEVMVECGPAAETILKVATSRKADLIVMGAHRASIHSLAPHLPWATASAVVAQACCPVLTVRS